MIRAVLAERFAGDRSAQQDGSADQSNRNVASIRFSSMSLAPGYVLKSE